MASNITERHREAFNALMSGKYDNFVLMSCYVNCDPAAAICAIRPSEDGRFEVAPLFVSLTANMCLTDHEGVEPTPIEEGE